MRLVEALDRDNRYGPPKFLEGIVCLWRRAGIERLTFNAKTGEFPIGLPAWMPYQPACDKRESNEASSMALGKLMKKLQ